MKSLLTEGGLYGHMSHLHENPDLTFSRLKFILTSAANGQIKGTEKTDGQNLNVSYSVKEGKAKAARNKTNVIDGGLNADQLYAMFENHVNQNLKDVFSDALKAFEKIIDPLPIKKKIRMFGEDTEIYYNCEVLDDRTPNVYHYDTKNLIIHLVGHAKYDRDTGKATNEEVDASELIDYVNAMQEKMANEKYGVKVNALKTIEGLADMQHLDNALESIDRVKENYQLNDESTLKDLIVKRLEEQLSNLNLPPEIISNLVNKMMIGSVNTKDIKDANIKAVAKEVLANSNIYLGVALEPMEMIINDFAIEMLKGYESAFILNNKSEVERLKQETANAIKAIQAANNDMANEILARQIKKLKSIENISASAEGVVFSTDGHTFKFTGTFAPMNQILGLFKYGRKGVKIQEGILTEEEQEIPDSPRHGYDIVLFSGGFKPPHKGHMSVVEQVAEKTRKLYIVLSPKPRYVKVEDKNYPVSDDISLKIWNEYLDAAGLQDRVKVIVNRESPIKYSIDFIANSPEVASGMRIGLATSEKDPRYDNISKYAKEGVIAEPIIIPTMKEDDTVAVSATEFRNAIASKRPDMVAAYMPPYLSNKMELATELIDDVFSSDFYTDDQLAAIEKEKKKKKPAVAKTLEEQILLEVIKRIKGKYCLLSKDSNKKLGCYPSKKGAEKREKQVNYFKHLKKEEASMPANSLAAGSVQFPAKTAFPPVKKNWENKD